MATIEPQTDATSTYLLEGTMLEACDCNVLCPCWIGEDPDGGTCNAVFAYHIEQGRVGDVDVSGLTWLGVTHIPGNILHGNIRALFFTDDEATPEQLLALTDVFTGRLGGPPAELAQLFGEVLGVLQVPIDYAIEQGQGVVRVGDRVSTSMTPYRSAYGKTTTLHDSIFSSIPGSPAWGAKASELDVRLPEHGLEWRVEGGNAIQGMFRFEA
jgi:hypothetical protein